MSSGLFTMNVFCSVDFIAWCQLPVCQAVCGVLLRPFDVFWLVSEPELWGLNHIQTYFIITREWRWIVGMLSLSACLLTGWQIWLQYGVGTTFYSGTEDWTSLADFHVRLAKSCGKAQRVGPVDTNCYNFGWQFRKLAPTHWVSCETQDHAFVVGGPKNQLVWTCWKANRSFSHFLDCTGYSLLLPSTTAKDDNNEQVLNNGQFTPSKCKGSYDLRPPSLFTVRFDKWETVWSIADGWQCATSEPRTFTLTWSQGIHPSIYPRTST